MKSTIGVCTCETTKYTYIYKFIYLSKSPDLYCYDKPCDLNV